MGGFGADLGRLALVPPADTAIVDERSVKAAQIAHADLRRIYVQKTVMPGNGLVGRVIRKKRLALGRASGDGRSPFVEDVSRPLERAIHDLEYDLGRLFQNKPRVRIGLYNSLEPLPIRIFRRFMMDNMDFMDARLRQGYGGQGMD
jgi:hypothetical protein